MFLSVPKHTKTVYNTDGELLAPQRGQGMGVERAVALSSMSRALKTWPQLGQRNNVVPLSMVVLLLFF